MAVQIKNVATSATTSTAWADQASPFQIPDRSETAYVSGNALATARSAGGSIARGKKRPDSASIGYRTNVAIGCAKRAVGTRLAITNPIERIDHVANSTANANEKYGT